MDTKRLIFAFFIGMALGLLTSTILALVKVELGTWLGLLAFAIYFVAGYYIAPRIIKLFKNGK
jgi:hypothetical protein